MASSPGSEPTEPSRRRSTVHVASVDAVSVAVVEAIADRRDVDPAEVDVHLTEHVDPDALDALYRHARANDDASWSLEFDVDGHAVAVRSDGRIVVD